MTRIRFISKRILWHLRHTNFVYTMIVNFRFLPFNVAIKFPIHIMGKVSFQLGENGKLNFTDNPIKPLSLHVGDCNLNFCHKNTSTTIRIHGEMSIQNGIDIQRGANITVTPTGKLTLHENVQICSNTKIVCSKSITIGKCSQISHESQIFDTNFHVIRNLTTNEESLSSSIHIGEFCWIGNRTTINMGTTIPDHTIIGSCSLLNKDYSKYGKDCVIAGVPAKFISNDRVRLWDETPDSKFNTVLL